MVRILAIPVLLVSFAASAYAQTATQAATPESAAAARAAGRNVTAGMYTGRVKDEGGARFADVKINIKNVTPDGRVTATAESTHTRASCAKALPLNGIMLPDGDMRLTVDDGAPEGCERIYHVKTAPGGVVSGTFIDGKTGTKAAGVLR